MKKSLDLLEGNIFRSLLKLSLPLMGTAFVQMCYSLVDLMWLGRLSTGAVAAVGTIFYMDRKIPYNHAIWHLFVLAASVAHFIGIFDAYAI